MPYHLASTFIWPIAQLLLILHFCLCREGTIEESIRTKRVISYLKNPASDFSRYERKKVVEIFHHIVKKILPPYPINDTDYMDPKASSLSLRDRKRRELKIPKSFEYDVDDGVLSESGGYSVKVLDDPSRASSNQLESFYDDNILMAERPIGRRVIKRSPTDDSNITETPKSEDYYRKVWKRVEEIVSEKKIRKRDSRRSSDSRVRKRKCIDDDNDDDDDEDDDDEETQIESGIRLGDDQARLLSLLTLLPVETSDTTEDDDEESKGGLQMLLMCVFGAFALLGIAILIMGIYSAALTHVRGGGQVENFKRTCLDTINKISGVRSEDSVTECRLKMKMSQRSSEAEGPKRDPQDVSFLLRTFVKVLSKKPSRSLNQKYGSKTHIKAVRKICRKKI